MVRYIRSRNIRDTQRGYSLIELITVMVIIGILASLVILIPTRTMDSSTDQERVDDVKSIARQLETSYDNQALGYPSYPSTQELLASIASNTGAMKGIETEALKAPGSDSSSLRVATSTSLTAPIGGGVTKSLYVYQPFTRSGSLCTAKPSTSTLSTTCVRFNLYYYSVTDGIAKKIESIRQQ